MTPIMPKSDCVALTKTEIKILQVMADHPNWDYNDCANHLCVQRSTVNTHMNSILKKLDCVKLMAAVIEAWHQGYISIRKVRLKRKEPKV